MGKDLDIGYYERMGGPTYGPGHFPKEWMEETEKMILKAVEDGIKEGIEKDTGTIKGYHGYERMMEDWAKHNGIKFEKPAEDHGVDMLYIQLTPRVKWFKPPLRIKIFKWEINMEWAYKVHRKCLLKDCYPVAASSSFDVEPSHGIDDEFIKQEEERAKNLDPAPKEVMISFETKSEHSQVTKDAAKGLGELYTNIVNNELNEIEDNDKNSFGPKEVTLEWSCQKFESEVVEEVAENMKENMKDFINRKVMGQGPMQSLVDDWDGDYVYDKSINAWRAPKYPGEVGDKMDFFNANFNPNCDLLVGNRPENDSDQQYINCNQCHRFRICCNAYYKTMFPGPVSQTEEKHNELEEYIKFMKNKYSQTEWEIGWESLPKYINHKIYNKHTNQIAVLNWDSGYPELYDKDNNKVDCFANDFRHGNAYWIYRVGENYNEEGKS